MPCPRCGVKVPENSRSCFVCAAPLSDGAPAAPSVPPLPVSAGVPSSHGTPAARVGLTGESLPSAPPPNYLTPPLSPPR